MAVRVRHVVADVASAIAFHTGSLGFRVERGAASLRSSAPSSPGHGRGARRGREPSARRLSVTRS